MDELKCKNRAMAFTILDTLADSMKGRHREAVLAVRDWMKENLIPDFDPETVKRIQKIFEGDEAEQLGRAWYNRGSKNINGKLTPTEPEHGARIRCLWNGKTKKWEPEWIPPEHQEAKAYKPDERL
jgi:hypothetical protein